MNNQKVLLKSIKKNQKVIKIIKKRAQIKILKVLI